MTGRPPRRPVRLASLLLGSAILAECDRQETPVLTPLSPLPGGPLAAAAPRVNGAVGSVNALEGPQVSIGRGRTVTLPAKPSVVQNSALLGYTKRAETAGLRRPDFGGQSVLCGRLRAAPNQAHWG